MRREGLFSFGSTHAKMSASFWLFMIGLGSMTQIKIGGYTAISEFFLVLLSPIALIKNYRLFAKDHCKTIVNLLLLWMVGVCLTDYVRGNYFMFFIRGFIAPWGTLAALVTIYPLLRRNPDALKWYLLGVAISGVVSIFVFQPGTTVGTYAVQSGEMSASEMRMSYKLFWVGQLNTWLGLPIEGWYMTFPIAAAVVIGLFLSAFSLVTGGRSAFMVLLLTTVLIAMCGHSRKLMQSMRRNTILVVAGLLLMAPVVKGIYNVSATRGWMGDKELTKYEEQAKGVSALEMLMRGRGEFFVSLFAALDKPFLGHGSFARDTKGYVMDYLVKYGADYDAIKRLEMSEKMYGVRLIPGHSHITCYWMWAGIPGLLPWLYILYLFYVTLFKRSYAYPAYFGYFAFMIPNEFWAIFFSPYGGRVNMGFLIAACLVVKAMEREQKQRGVLWR